MRSLVTGACGFVGRHLIRHLLECGDDVLATDLSMPSEAIGCPFEVLDVSSSDAVAGVLGRYRPEAVYHLAGMAFVPDAEGNFEGALKTNVLGTNAVYRMLHLLELPCVVVFVSSAEVYGRVSASDLPVTESTPLAPVNNYSLSKAMAELVAHRYGQGSQPRSVIVRPFNHIGPGQSPKFVASAFASQIARIAVGRAPGTVEVGNLEAERDFSDVRDIVRAYRLAAQSGNGIYNLCSGRAVSIQSLLDQLIEVSGVSVRIVQNPERMRGPEVRVLYGSCERASADLGWSPQYLLRDTLRDIYQYWFRKEQAISS